MSDIVQLKEDGVAKYLKTHASAIDGVDGILVKATGNETIEGNKNFSDQVTVASKRVLTVDDLPKSNVSLTPENGNTGTVLAYKEGRTVTLFFVLLNGKGGGGNGSTILTIPAGYRPPATLEQLIGSIDRGALNSAQISIGADGTVKWQRNSNYASDYTFAVTYTY